MLKKVNGKRMDKVNDGQGKRMDNQIKNESKDPLFIFYFYFLSKS